VLCKELVDWVVDQAIPGDFTFDSYFTNAEILNHITSKNRNYVGDLKFNRTITVDGKDWKASDWVKTQLGPLCRRKTTVDGKEQWYFTKSTLCHCTAIYWDVTALLHPPMWYALVTLLDVKAVVTVVLTARPKVWSRRCCGAISGDALAIPFRRVPVSPPPLPQPAHRCV
jgi:hypothetical protein